jgi:hypothetical protein
VTVHSEKWHEPFWFKVELHKEDPMKAEITFDLVMKESMDFVEGCYRLEGGAWQVFTFVRTQGLENVEVRKDLVWKSGVTGLSIFVGDDTALNKSTVIQMLADALAVTNWSEVQGPDSIQLR